MLARILLTAYSIFTVRSKDRSIDAWLGLLRSYFDLERDRSKGRIILNQYPINSILLRYLIMSYHVFAYYCHRAQFTSGKTLELLAIANEYYQLNEVAS